MQIRNTLWKHAASSRWHAFHSSQELNDPVMGGQSHGTWHVDQQQKLGIFDGEALSSSVDRVRRSDGTVRHCGPCGGGLDH